MIDINNLSALTLAFAISLILNIHTEPVEMKISIWSDNITRLEIKV